MDVSTAGMVVSPQTGSPGSSGAMRVPIELQRSPRGVFAATQRCAGLGGLQRKDAAWIEDLTYCRRTVKRGESLYRGGDKFASLYVVHSGFFKTEQMLEDGRQQVIGFHMPGELMGLEAIEGDVHICRSVALEDSEVCVIPYSRLSDGGRDKALLQRQFHKAMSHAIGRQHIAMLLLGTMRASERVARFLLMLSERLAGLGYSPSEFHLRMTRRDIGSYLGMNLETVSRILTKLQKAGFIDVDQRHIRILDIAGLADCPT